MVKISEIYLNGCSRNVLKIFLTMPDLQSVFSNQIMDILSCLIK